MKNSPSTASASRGAAWRWAALCALAFLLAWPGAALAGRKRIVVLELTGGPKAEQFQKDLEKLLKKKHSVVPRAKWDDAADAVGATKLTDKNVQRIAGKLNVDGVVLGKVEKRGSRFYLHLQLRAGASGKVIAKPEIIERQGGLGSDGRADVEDQLLPIIDDLPALGGDDDEDEDADEDDDDDRGGRPGWGRGKGKPAADEDDEDDGDEISMDDEDAPPRGKGKVKGKTKRPPPPAKGKGKAKGKTKPPPVDDEEDDDEEDDDRAADRDDRNGRGGRGADRGRGFRGGRDDEDEDDRDDRDDRDDEDDDRVADRDRDDDDDRDRDDEDDEDRDDRDRDDRDDVELGETARVAESPAIDLAAGLSFTGRRLSFTTNLAMNAPQGYKGSPVPGLRITASAFPLAMNKQNRSFTRNLGVQVLFDRALKITSTLKKDAMSYDLPTVEQHLAFGVVYRHPIGAALTVEGSLRFNKRKFVIDKSPAPQQSDVDIPNTDYSYIDPGLGLTYALDAKTSLGADARFLLITSTGEMQQADQYGAATVTGVDLEASFDYRVAPKILLRASAGFATIGFAFKGNGDLTNNRDGEPGDVDVSGARDTYFGGSATGVYLF